MFYFAFCGDEIHKIGVQKGKLILYNHPEEEAENEFIVSKLTSMEPKNECFKIYKSWKEKKIDELPVLIKTLLEEGEEKYE
jgi:hypothetical protein